MAAIALAACIAAGCEASEAVDDRSEVQTAHLRITTSADQPICAGTPLLLEDQLVRISEALGLPLWPEDDKLDVALGRDAISETCSLLFEDPEDGSGCAVIIGGELVVAAAELTSSAPHELVHAVRLYNGASAPIVFEEGLAQVVSGSDGFPLYVTYPHGEPTVGPVELLDVTRSEFGFGFYVPAQSFVSWLWETQGRPTLLAFVDDPRLSDPEAVLPVFEEHFGASLEALEQAWRDDERPDPIWGAPCIDGRTYSLADGPVELSGELDCEQPDVYGATVGMALWPMCLEVPATTRVRLTLEADHGRLQVLGREACDAGPAGSEAYRDKYLDAGDVLEEDIAGPCRYRMLVGSMEEGLAATHYVVRVEEAP